VHKTKAEVEKAEAEKHHYQSFVTNLILFGLGFLTS
jgi:hypothetical protein